MSRCRRLRGMYLESGTSEHPQHTAATCTPKRLQHPSETACPGRLSKLDSAARAHQSWRPHSLLKARYSLSSGRCGPAAEPRISQQILRLTICTNLAVFDMCDVRCTQHFQPDVHTTCSECRKCRPRATSSATLRPRRHQLSRCAAPPPPELLCSALNRSPPCRHIDSLAIKALGMTESNAHQQGDRA